VDPPPRRLDGLEVAPHLARRAQAVDVGVESGQELEHPGAIIAGIAQDPAEERQVEALGAAGRQVGPLLAADEAPERAPQARPGRQVEEDDGVGVRGARCRGG
jgi:hypothetical protein